MSNLSFQADPPTLKNLGLIEAGARFSKNQGLGSKDALDCVLELSWAPFECPFEPSRTPKSSQDRPKRPQVRPKILSKTGQDYICLMQKCDIDKYIFKKNLGKPTILSPPPCRLQVASRWPQAQPRWPEIEPRRLSKTSPRSS